MADIASLDEAMESMRPLELGIGELELGTSPFNSSASTATMLCNYETYTLVVVK